MNIALIAAVSENGVIGDRGRIPWQIPADLKRFKRLTMGHPIIMGRKTFESIGRLLPGRLNIVLTRNPAWPAPAGARVFGDLDAALRHCRQSGESIAFVIGGADLYRAALPLADILHITHVHQRVEGDTRFPDYDRAQWQEAAREHHADCSFVEYRRAPNA
jgi:dihydrofolate reductase